MKNLLIEIKTQRRRLESIEEKNSELEDKLEEIAQCRTKRQRDEKYERQLKQYGGWNEKA